MLDPPRAGALALVDMFPQTGHIELLAAFVLEGRARRRQRREP